MYILYTAGKYSDIHIAIILLVKTFKNKTLPHQASLTPTAGTGSLCLGTTTETNNLVVKQSSR